MSAFDNFPKSRFTVIIKPTTACNLSCSYCYVGPDEEIMSMKEEIFETFLYSLPDVIKEKGRVTLLWHGGEPLLRGLNFFEKVLKLEKELESEFEIKIENSMQTNLTLVDERTAKFIKEAEIHVGTSIDGPEHFHNKTRKYPDGRGSFQDVMKGLKNLGKYDVKVGAICVLTKINKDHMREIYYFFKSLNIGFKLNPLINSERVKNQEELLGISSYDYLNSLKELFEIWYYDPDPSISVDTLAWEVIEPILTGNCGLCCYDNKSCQQHFFSLYPNGNIYPCGRFGKGDEFLYGNIMEKDLKTILQSEKRKLFLKRIEKLEDCKICPEIKLCNGGCPHNAYVEYGTIYEKDPYCLSRKGLIQYVRECIKRDLEKAKVEG